MSNSCNCHHLRYVVMVLITFGSILQYILNIDIGLLAYPDDFLFVSQSECANFSQTLPSILWHTTVNYSNINEFTRPKFTKDDRAFIQSSYLYGIISSQLLAGYLCTHYNIRNVLGYSVTIAAILNFFYFTTDYSEEIFSVWELFFYRLSVAFLSSFMFPGFYGIISNWTPPNERATFIFGILLGIDFGQIVLKPLIYSASLQMIKELWYTMISILLFMWVAAWFAFIKTSPVQHKWLAYEEILHITGKQEEQGCNHTAMMKGYLPQWREVVFSPTFLAVLVPTFCYHWNWLIMITYYPYFISRIVGFEVNITSYLTVLPIIIHCIGALLCILIEKTLLKYKNISNIRKIFSVIGFIFPGFIILAEVTLDCNPLLSWILLCFISLFHSAAVVSILPNVIDIAPSHAAFIFGILNSGASLSYLLCPLVYKTIIDDTHRSRNWRPFLTLSASLYLFSGVLYLLLGTGEVRFWYQKEDPVWQRKVHRLPHLPHVLSDIIEESESKTST